VLPAADVIAEVRWRSASGGWGTGLALTRRFTISYLKGV
jgi:hypothetical protein